MAEELTNVQKQLLRIKAARDRMRTDLNGFPYKDANGVNVSVNAEKTLIGGIADAVENLKNNLTKQTATAAKVLNGETFVGADGRMVTGSIPSVTGKHIYPTKTDQTIDAEQYISGAQVYEAVQHNISASDVVYGKTAKIGCDANDTSVDEIEGTFSYADARDAIEAKTVLAGKIGFVNGRRIMGGMPRAQFLNQEVRDGEERTFTDVSEQAPVLISGDYLYITEGHVDNVKISLAKLVPDGASADLAAPHILSGYSAYDNDGKLIAGSIPNRVDAGKAFDALTETEYTIPEGYYNGTGKVVLTDDLENALAAI